HSYGAVTAATALRWSQIPPAITTAIAAMVPTTNQIQPWPLKAAYAAPQNASQTNPLMPQGLPAIKTCGDFARRSESSWATACRARSRRFSAGFSIGVGGEVAG